MPTDEQNLEAIYNAGERLVPGKTHDRSEIVRHKSSYQLFRRIIESDILSDTRLLETGIRILDIGCGTGHGTFMLSSILGAKIVGIDPSFESIEYAKENYYADNIEYVNVDVETFVNYAPQFDYIVSRHALEHVEDGLNSALKFICSKRLMVNVPFNESEGNVHHKVHWIKESDFGFYPNREFLYEGLDGITRLDRADENHPNSIICISSASGLRATRELFDFPFPCWQPEFLQDLSIRVVDLNLREAWATEKDSLLAIHETNLRALEVDLNQREVNLNRREAWATEKESLLATHETNLRAIEVDLNQREIDLNQREAWATEKDSLLAIHETNLRALEADLNRREIDLNQREAVIVNSLCGRVSRMFRKLKSTQ